MLQENFELPIDIVYRDQRRKRTKLMVETCYIYDKRRKGVDQETKSTLVRLARYEGRGGVK